MENLMTHLDNAYQCISKLPVSGDAVDLMAAARLELRAAWKEAEKLKEETEDGSKH